MNINHFMGNLTHDPEFKNVGAKGTGVVNFSIAVSRKYKRQSGEVVKEVTYIPLEAWDSGAETIYRHFKKGDPIIVHCSAKNETWEDKNDGKQRSRIKFRVTSFEFVGRPRQSNDSDSKDTDNQSFGYDQDNNNDIPF